MPLLVLYPLPDHCPRKTGGCSQVTTSAGPLSSAVHSPPDHHPRREAEHLQMSMPVSTASLAVCPLPAYRPGGVTVPPKVSTSVSIPMPEVLSFSGLQTAQEDLVAGGRQPMSAGRRDPAVISLLEEPSPHISLTPIPAEAAYTKKEATRRK